MKKFVSMILVTGLLFSVVAESATVSTILHGGTMGGVTVHPTTGDIYASEFGGVSDRTPNKRVFRITAAGVITTFASGFTNAEGNDFDSNGNLFQTNMGDGRFSKITPSGGITTFARFGGPSDVVIDSQDTMYVVDFNSSRIAKVLPNGSVTTVVRSSVLNQPNGITLDANDNLYVSSFGGGAIFKLEKSGSFTRFAQVPGQAPHLTSANGKLYVTSWNRHAIYEIPIEGSSHPATLIAGQSGFRGGADGSALEATFDSPNGITVNRDGTILYVNDKNGVRQITLDEPSTPITSTVGLSGAWFDPALDGEGYNLIFFAGGMVVYFYGSTTTGERLWLLSDVFSGPLSFGEVAEITMFEATSGEFLAPVPSAQSLTPWGVLKMQFDDCANGVFELDGADGVKSSNVQQLVGIDGAVCN